MLKLSFSSHFQRDLKALDKKHVDDTPLCDVLELIAEDSKKSKHELKTRHKMHKLKGDWEGNFECHIANIGDWLLIWRVRDGFALIERTGTHDELFKKGK